MRSGESSRMTQGRSVLGQLSIDAARARSRPRVACRGALRASVLLVGLCAVCLAAAVALIFGLRSDGDGHADASATGSPYARSESAQRAVELAEPRRAEAPPTSNAPRTPVEPGVAAPSFEGRGVIRGRLSAAAGLAFPQSWTLVLFPNRFLQGHERAVSRAVEFTHGEQVFRVDDLPLGGYGVRAEARGLNCLPVNVLLVTGAENQFVSLALSPSGFLQGSLLDADGRPAEGVPVTLEGRATHARRTLETDAAGSYRFDAVIDGEYTLCFGRPEAPLVPPDSLAFRAPALSFPIRTLPATGAARILTRDEEGRHLSDVAISGFSLHAGVVDARSDNRGTALVRYLPAGRYRLHARLEDGRSGTAVAQIVAGETAEVDIRLRP